MMLVGCWRGEPAKPVPAAPPPPPRIAAAPTSPLDELRDDMLEAMAAYTSDLCRCSPYDVACAERVVERVRELTVEMNEQWERYGIGTYDADLDLAKRLQPTMDRYFKCLVLATTPATP
jgi:hypothetical protein